MDRPAAGGGVIRQRAARPRHLVDELIEERAGPLLARPLLWALVRRLGFPLLRYRQAMAMVDALAPLDGAAGFDWLSGHLNLDCAVTGLERVPRSGRLVVVANHPTGIADGVALWDTLGRVRRDLVYFANRDALRVAPGMAQTVIPVEWQPARRTRARSRETAAASVRAFRAERAVALFPSGRLAHRVQGQLVERPWLPTAVNLAVRYDAPVLPVHISGDNSALFHWLARYSEPLRDMCLFHELLNKRGYPYRIQIGPMLPPAALAGDPLLVTARLQQWLEQGLPAAQPAPDFAAG